MAQDRFVYFKKCPARSDVRKALEDYVSGTGEVEWSKDRFFVTLTGKGKHPARRLAGAHPAAKNGEIYREERFIEVWLGKGVIDVITRQADDYTNAVADGFAQFARHFWHGSIDLLGMRPDVARLRGRI